MDVSTYAGRYIHMYIYTYINTYIHMYINTWHRWVKAHISNANVALRYFVEVQYAGKMPKWPKSKLSAPKCIITYNVGTYVMDPDLNSPYLLHIPTGDCQARTKFPLFQSFFNILAFCKMECGIRA
jgi:hypothetical protein